MGEPNEERRPSTLRFIARELAILVVGVAVLFVLLGLIVWLVAPLLGLRMCCQ